MPQDIHGLINQYLFKDFRALKQAMSSTETSSL